MSSGTGRSSAAKRHARQLRAARARSRERESEPTSTPLASLPDHRKKLSRAQTHIEEVEGLLKLWSGPDCYKVAMEPDGKGGAVLAGTLLKALPDPLGLVIGDALQCMRSSLDNLAFSLAKRNKPGLTPDEEEHVSFPIYDDPPTASRRSIKHMSQSAQNAIISLCQYPHIHAKEEDALWLLNKTNNRDKHRAITVAVADVSDYGMSVSGIIHGPGQFGLGGPKRATKVGDRNVFAEFGPGSQVQVNVGATLKVVFGEGIEVSDREVLSTLTWFHDHIRDTVFHALEPHL